MNKKVEKFAKKVGFTDFDLMHHSGEMLEKFAQLIVKECADNAENIVGDLSTYVNPQYVSRAIKKPFGVK